MVITPVASVIGVSEDNDGMVVNGGTIIACCE